MANTRKRPDVRNTPVSRPRGELPVQVVPYVEYVLDSSNCCSEHDFRISQIHGAMPLQSVNPSDFFVLGVNPHATSRYFRGIGAPPA